MKRKHGFDRDTMIIGTAETGESILLNGLERNLLIMGSAGTGRTTILLRLLRDEIAKGNGVTFVDGKSDRITGRLIRETAREFGREADLVSVDLMDSQMAFDFDYAISSKKIMHIMLPEYKMASEKTVMISESLLDDMLAGAEASRNRRIKTGEEEARHCLLFDNFGTHIPNKIDRLLGRLHLYDNITLASTHDWMGNLDILGKDVETQKRIVSQFPSKIALKITDSDTAEHLLGLFNEKREEKGRAEIKELCCQKPGVGLFIGKADAERFLADKPLYR